MSSHRERIEAHFGKRGGKRVAIAEKAIATAICGENVCVFSPTKHEAESMMDFVELICRTKHRGMVLLSSRLEMAIEIPLGGRIEFRDSSKPIHSDSEALFDIAARMGAFDDKE